MPVSGLVANAGCRRQHRHATASAPSYFLPPPHARRSDRRRAASAPGPSAGNARILTRHRSVAGRHDRAIRRPVRAGEPVAGTVPDRARKSRRADSRPGHPVGSRLPSAVRYVARAAFSDVRCGPGVRRARPNSLPASRSPGIPASRNTKWAGRFAPTMTPQRSVRQQGSTATGLFS